ncbi:hypothetical protein ACFQZI_04500 [Mucilaginibacter lutimaris]|uniref:Uncharacterized protein n=1 Tax=Mucilaginibacter lutimaris TaxID=931629 RepID=A0ABW2ZD46_9SPHI
MKKNLLALIVMLCGFAGIANAQSLAVNVKTSPVVSVESAKVVKPVTEVKTDVTTLAAVNAEKKVAAAPTACYTHTLSANQGFSTTYQWTDCSGVVRQQHIERGGSTTVCAQEGTVSGGPWTKNGPCQ